MKIVDRILAIYSVVFHSGLCLFFLGMGIVAKISGSTLNLPMLPWSGAAVADWLIGLSLFGLLASALAGAGKLKWLLAIFATYVFCQMAYGFYVGPHRFENYDDFRQSLTMSSSAFAAAGAAIRGAFKKRS